MEFTFGVSSVWINRDRTWEIVSVLFAPSLFGLLNKKVENSFLAPSKVLVVLVVFVLKGRKAAKVKPFMLANVDGAFNGRYKCAALEMLLIKILFL